MSPLPWTFDKDRAALIVVDMQQDFVNPGAIMEVPMARRQVPAMRRILDRCRQVGVPAIFTRHVLSDHFEVSPLETAYQPQLKTAGMREESAGIEIISDLAPRQGEVIIEKHRYDAFYDTRLDTILRNIRGPRQVDTLIIIGTVTSVCCESTARSAFMRDYKVAFISDANGGFDQKSHDATLDILGRVFARVMTTDELLEQF